MGSINLVGVSKSFGDVLAIPSVDLEVNEGEFVVFVGPSGSGKSTLLRDCGPGGGLQRQDRIQWSGHDQPSTCQAWAGDGLSVLRTISTHERA